jgi:alpha-amylase
MKSVCVCFQIHHPYHTKWYWPDKGYNSQLDLDLYFDSQKNYISFSNLCRESFIPTLETLLKTIEKHDSKYALNVSGTLLEQCKWDPAMIVALRTLANTGNIEFLCSPYYNSISSLLNNTEYFTQHVLMHKRKIMELFNCNTNTFVNSDLICTPGIPSIIEKMGFQTLITEGAENILNGRNPTGLFNYNDLAVLTRHISLSEDLEKRFSSKTWIEYPLIPEKFASWISNMKGDVLLLYVDCATFGGHYNSGSFIFDFLEKFPAELAKRNIDMITPSKAFELFEATKLPTLEKESVARYGMFNLLDNHMQNLYFHELIDIGKYLENITNPLFREIFGYLQQVDILSSMNSHNIQISFEVAMNNFSILSDFKRRIIGESK